MGHRREQHDMRFSPFFGRWPCNASQGHCTTTTCFVIWQCDELYCCPLSTPTPNQSVSRPRPNPCIILFLFRLLLLTHCLICNLIFSLMTHPMGGGGGGRPQHRHLSVIESISAVGKVVVAVGRADLNGILRMVHRDCDCVSLSGPRHFCRYCNCLLLSFLSLSAVYF